MFDTHVHLEDEDDAARRRCWARAREQGISEVLVPGFDPAQWERAEAAAALERPRIHLATGLHPWRAHEATAGLEATLKEAVARSSAVAIGETGIDKVHTKRGGASLDVQADLMRRHLTVAAELGLPVILHVVRAHGMALEVLHAHAGSAPVRGVVHGFTAAREVALAYVELGLHIGFGAALSRPDMHRAHAAFGAIPEDRVVLESDVNTADVVDWPASLLTTTRAADELRPIEGGWGPRAADNARSLLRV